MAAAIATAPDEDRERSTSAKTKPVNPKEKPTMATSDSIPAPPDDAAVPEKVATPTPSLEPTQPEPPAAPTTPPPERPEPPDPFDPAALRLGADYAEGLGVRKVITLVPNRKPNKSEWFQVRPGDAWRLQTAVLELERGIERSTYLVAPSLWAELSGEISPALLLTCINRANDLFLWRIKLPGPDGRSNTWTESALEIAQAAAGTWCRMKSDTTNGIYSHWVSTEPLSDPKWPDLSFNEIIKLAFRGRMIDSLDHPVLRELRGGA
jgi:hypothetical protein